MTTTKLLTNVWLSVGLLILPALVYSQDVSNVTIPSEEELREALSNGDISIEEFQLLLEYMQGATFPNLNVVAGNIPNLDLLGLTNRMQLDRLQQEQLDAIRAAENSPAKNRVRLYIDQELNTRERTRSVYQIRLGASEGWRFDGSVARAFGQSALWRSRSLRWNDPESNLSVIIGNFNLRWGTGLAFGYRSRLLQRQNDFSFESLRTPDRGGFNGLSVSGALGIHDNHTLRWRAIGSTQQDIERRLNTVGVMGDITFAGTTIGALYGYSTLNLRSDSGSFRQNQLSVSLTHSRSATFWYNTEINTQDNDGIYAIAVNSEWRYNTADGNIRGAFWRYPTAYRNLTGGARSGILYESLDIDDIAFSYRERRVNQTGGLLRSVTALDADNKLETGIEFSKQNRGSASRGDYILALIHQIHSSELKLEAGGRSVSSSATDLKSRWRLRAQLTTGISTAATQIQIRSALAYRKQISTDPALGLFARLRATWPNKQQLELWLDINRFRWWNGGLERMYSYVQYSAPLDYAGSLTALTKLVYSYTESATNRSRIVARVEVQSRW